MQRCKEIEKEDEASCRSEIWIWWEGNPLKCNAGRRIERLFLSDQFFSSIGLGVLKVADSRNPAWPAVWNLNC